MGIPEKYSVALGAERFFDIEKSEAGSVTAVIVNPNRNPHRAILPRRDAQAIGRKLISWTAGSLSDPGTLRERVRARVVSIIADKIRLLRDEERIVMSTESIDRTAIDIVLCFDQAIDEIVGSAAANGASADSLRQMRATYG